MKYNQLGNTGLKLSAMGFGTWGIGGGDYDYGWGDQDDHDSMATIRRAVECGINWIDTAPVYGLGHSEKIVAKALKGHRDQIVISTKCGFRWDANKNIFPSLKKESIRFEIEESLRRLETDVIDLYQIHKPTPEEEIEEAWVALNDLVKEGKIRYAGVSTFSLEQLKRVHAIHPVSFIQPPYNLIQNEIERDGTLDFCQRNNIGVITFSPMYMGLLSGKFTIEKIKHLPANDSRQTEDYFKEPFVNYVLEMIERLRPIAERNHQPMPLLPISWVLRRSEVTAAIVGARKPQQIDQTISAVDWELSSEEIRFVDSILEDYHQLIKN
ncbi:MAG: aldo/keto reductase [Candidatus Omnitrophota bacterium]